MHAISAQDVQQIPSESGKWLANGWQHRSCTSGMLTFSSVAKNHYGSTVYLEFVPTHQGDQVGPHTCSQSGLWKGVKAATAPSAGAGWGTSRPRSATSTTGASPPTNIPAYGRATPAGRSVAGFQPLFTFALSVAPDLPRPTVLCLMADVGEWYSLSVTKHQAACFA